MIARPGIIRVIIIAEQVGLQELDLAVAGSKRIRPAIPGSGR